VLLLLKHHEHFFSSVLQRGSIFLPFRATTYQNMSPTQPT
jgi:hypothetical protein